MKILLITSSFPRNGRIGGIFIPDTVQALNKMGVIVHIFTQNCDSTRNYSETLWPGCEITYFGWKGKDVALISLFKKKISGIFFVLQYFLNGIMSGRRICRKWNPDIIFAEWLIPSGLIAAIISKSTKIPYCCRGLGSDVYFASENLLIRPFIKYVARNSKYLFADGFDLCRKTSELADGRECYFAATARKLDNKKSDFRPLDDTGFFTFCSVGRLHLVKGFDFLINACSLLQKKNINFRCYIAGEGEEKEKLKYLIDSLDLEKKVILTGRLEDGDISDLFRHVDCIVIPSLSESIPLVLSEGVNAHKPLIVTSVGDMGYLAEKYKLGYAVEKENSHELAEALIKMSDTKIRTSFYDKRNYDELSSILSPDSGAKAIFEKINQMSMK
ncbi:MAG: glycosyltransferase [Bacteroidales bacterium]